MTTPEDITKTIQWLRSLADQFEKGEVKALSCSTHNDLIEVEPEDMARKFEFTGIQAYIFVSGKEEDDQPLVTARMEHLAFEADQMFKPH